MRRPPDRAACGGALWERTCFEGAGGGSDILNTVDQSANDGLLRGGIRIDGCCLYVERSRTDAIFGAEYAFYEHPVEPSGATASSTPTTVPFPAPTTVVASTSTVASECPTLGVAGVVECWANTGNAVTAVASLADASRIIGFTAPTLHQFGIPDLIEPIAPQSLGGAVREIWYHGPLGAVLVIAGKPTNYDPSTFVSLEQRAKDQAAAQNRSEPGAASVGLAPRHGLPVLLVSDARWVSLNGYTVTGYAYSIVTDPGTDPQALLSLADDLLDTILANH